MAGFCVDDGVGFVLFGFCVVCDVVFLLMPIKCDALDVIGVGVIYDIDLEIGLC